MNAEEPKPRLALAVEPLDEGSRFLVPRADPALIDERTGQRDEDLPSTEPDGIGNDRRQLRSNGYVHCDQKGGRQFSCGCDLQAK